MKSRRPSAEVLWKQFEEDVVPQLSLSLIERAIYLHLLRRSHLEGRPRVHFSIASLARGASVSQNPTREAVRRLANKGLLRVVERRITGHVVEVKLPGDIASPGANGARGGTGRAAPIARPAEMSLEEMDFLQIRNLRLAIHSREQGRCFYCMRRVSAKTRCLDHVVPRAEFGRNSYRNLVSCCVDCNSQKGERPAADFLRWLYREGKLTTGELSARLRALKALASGKLRPVVVLKQTGRKGEGGEVNGRKTGSCQATQSTLRDPLNLPEAC